MHNSLLKVNVKAENEYCSYRRPEINLQHPNWPAHKHLLQGVSSLL